MVAPEISLDGKSTWRVSASAKAARSWLSGSPAPDPFWNGSGFEGGGFHFYGPSSIGKSTLLRVAGSVWGGGGPLGFGHPWRATASALEGLAAAHNHVVLCLDEIGALDPADLPSAVYALAGGQRRRG
ncbi:DUF927 domain-containing protein [Prosthecomicrobium sp. N25]